MSQIKIEERVGALEGDVSRLRTDVALLGDRVADVKSQNSTILTVVQSLEKQNLTRPKSQDFKSLAAACAALAAVAVVGWWLIGTAPVIEEIRATQRELRSDLDRLDDPEIGKVPRLERQFGVWVPEVKRGK